MSLLLAQKNHLFALSNLFNVAQSKQYSIAIIVNSFLVAVKLLLFYVLIKLFRF